MNAVSRGVNRGGGGVQAGGGGADAARRDVDADAKIRRRCGAV